MAVGEVSRRASADLWLGMSIKNLSLVTVCISTSVIEYRRF